MAVFEHSFLIDANLPLHVSCWRGQRFAHVLRINPAWSDPDIWAYAKQHSLVIISKDKDFSLMQIKEGSPPKLVHVKLGNLKLAPFIARIEWVWQEAKSKRKP